jgi:hypothetical protein
LDKAVVTEILADEERSPFEFFGGKLARAHLVRCSENVHLFQLVCHHVIIDGWSAPILKRDFISAYFADSDDQGPWREQGKLYFGYLDWERSVGRAARKRLSLLRWRRWLSEAPSHSVSVHLDRPRKAALEICDAVHMEDLDSSLSDALAETARTLGLTVGAVVTAAIMLLLAEESGCDVPVAVMLDSGRSRPELARLCSFFAIPLLVSMRIERDMSLAAHASAVSKMLRDRRAEPMDWASLQDAYPHRPVAHPDRLAAFTFNIANFDMRSAAEGPGSAPRPAAASPRPTGAVDREPRSQLSRSDQVRFVPLPVEYRGYANPGDLCLNIAIGGELNCAWNYNSNLIEPGTLRRLSTRLAEIIRDICEQPSLCVREAVKISAPLGRQL